MEKRKHSLGSRLKEAAIERFGEENPQSLLAEKSEIPQPTISKIWRGAVKESAKTPRLAHVLGVESLWLAEGIGAKYVQNVAHRNNQVKIGSQGDLGVFWYQDITVTTEGLVLGSNGENREKMPFPESFFAQIESSPEHCFVTDIIGSSMEPTFFEGFTVLVDTKRREFVDGALFAFNYGDNCRIKRVFIGMDNRIRLSSDNPDKIRFPDEHYTYPQDKENPDIKPIGMVRWHSGFQ